MSSSSIPWWRPVLLGALAGGMGWGIRVQYGHETGAMIAGLLVSLAMALVFCPTAPSLPVARAVVWGTIAMGFGGSMTYGQTIGLTQDAPLVGHWAALRWGMLGLAIKGGLWIGFAGAFLGMGLGGHRYRAREVLGMMLGMIVLCGAGVWLLNEPFDPERHLLPRIYFSDDWRWEPEATLRPRREVWGGLLIAIAGLLAYLQWRRNDQLAVRLGLWGILGGVLGFPLGQSLQAFHAWNPDIFREGLWVTLDPVMNWWNFMEATFGATLGATLGLGLWSNRRLLRFDRTPEVPEISAGWEWLLLGFHGALLTAVEFLGVAWVDRVYDFGLALGLIPMVAVAGGRWWPWVLMLPVTLLPIAGKTLRRLAYEEQLVSPEWAWLLYGVVPMACTTVAAIRWARGNSSAPSAPWIGPALLGCTWLYFGLNFAFFHFPWPWQPWTSRTPNGLIYLLCALGLSGAVIGSRRRRDESRLG